MSAHAAFAEALLDPAAPCPPGLACWNGSDPAQRFAIYRNNVMVGLIDALAATYPVTQELVGEAFFRAMAREFVRAAPPRSPVLALYGQGFAEFIESFPPAASLPYLADLARLEMLRVLAWHAADAVPVAQEALAAALVDPESLPQASFRLVPALHLLASRHAIVSLWAAHQSETATLELPGINTDAAEIALVCRLDLDVAIYRLTPGAATFVAGLRGGLPFGEAASAALAADPDFDPAATLALLLGAGAIAGITPPRRPS